MHYSGNTQHKMCRLKMNEIKNMVGQVMTKDQTNGILEAMIQIAAASEKTNTEMERMRRYYEVMIEKVDIVNDLSRNKMSKKMIVKTKGL